MEEKHENNFRHPFEENYREFLAFIFENKELVLDEFPLDIIEIVDKQLNSLQEEKKRIIFESFGLNDGVVKKPMQVADKLGINVVTVNTKKAQVVNKMRESTRINSLIGDSASLTSLGTRAYFVLLRQGLETFNDLRNKLNEDPEFLGTLPGIGPKTQADILRKLEIEPSDLLRIRFQNAENVKNRKASDLLNKEIPQDIVKMIESITDEDILRQMINLANRRIIRLQTMKIERK
ncbi:MAG: hypothetical protein LBM38_02925 [Clostridiales bacterium]|jgi:hypothetical protein|nr:hypothetical protein [Clostridiales bacterium]